MHQPTRDVRPQLGRGQRVGQIVGGVRRRVVGEQVLDPLHQAAVGMQHQVGRELAGRGFGLHARDQLPARRADHLDADEGKLLAEFVDDLLLHLGEGRGVEEELALLARGLEQAVGGLVGGRGPRAADDRERAEPRGGRENLAPGHSDRVMRLPRSVFDRVIPSTAPPRMRARDRVTADSRRSCSTRRSIRCAA